VLLNSLNSFTFTFTVAVWAGGLDEVRETCLDLLSASFLCQCRTVELQLDMRPGTQQMQASSVPCAAVT
jgi:hypothetical protein